MMILRSIRLYISPEMFKLVCNCDVKHGLELFVYVKFAGCEFFVMEIDGKKKA